MLQANHDTWRGHTVGMCRTFITPGVLYHNYRIMYSFAQLRACMHDLAGADRGQVWIGWDTAWLHLWLGGGPVQCYNLKQSSTDSRCRKWSALPREQSHSLPAG